MQLLVIVAGLLLGSSAPARADDVEQKIETCVKAIEGRQRAALLKMYAIEPKAGLEFVSKEHKRSGNLLTVESNYRILGAMTETYKVMSSVTIDSPLIMGTGPDQVDCDLAVTAIQGALSF